MARKKLSANTTRSNSKAKATANSESAFHIGKLLSSNNLELVTALLLLSEKLKVDSIELDRRGGVLVTLVGEFQSNTDEENERVSHLASFLKKNGDMTIDEIFAVFKKRLSE
ncbi:hypothetical protein [Aneurinibacillus migulanus]|uniref:hypothetical protein n=1 Tax=Aneurinibacillus migulanus TaxID=47500 RepID=UPI000695B13A|nr:hypothetical protein [Aneurinibacillus migulanus]MCP1355891.1 hypothetical protein [Aneurinibacillus migulanus]